MALAGRDAQGFAIPGLGEGGELLGRQRVEGDLLVPGLGVVPTTISRFGTSARTPKPSPSVSSTSPRGPGAGGLAAEHGRDRPQPEDALHDRCGLQVHALGDRDAGQRAGRWAWDARTTDRWGPLGSDAVWTNGGPAPPARGGSGAPRRGPCRGKVDPRRLPPTSEPRLGDRLVRGSPGGVWARDIPLYRRAVPGHRHGGTPASCLFKPCALRWLASITWNELADEGNPPVAYQPSAIARRLNLRFTLEVQRSGQGLCPTLLRLPGPLVLHLPGARQPRLPTGGHCCGHQEAGRHADRPRRPGREHRHPG